MMHLMMQTQKLYSDQVWR